MAPRLQPWMRLTRPVSNSLADQTHHLAVALGANQVGPGGLPHQTFAAVRPLLEGVIKAWSQPASAETVRPDVDGT